MTETKADNIPDPELDRAQVWLVMSPAKDHQNDQLVCSDLPDEGRMVVKIEVIPLIPENKGKSATSGESAILKRLQHDHIVRCIDSGECENSDYQDDSGYLIKVQQYFLKMEYVGDNLRTWLNNKGTSPGKLVSILADFSCQCFGALAYLQECGIVHCDIKPENLLVAESPDGKAIIKIADFGFAYDAGKEGFKVCKNGEGAAISGSAQFAAPETKPKHGKEQTQTHKSDIYSFGLTIASILCNYAVIDAGYMRIPDGTDRELTLKKKDIPMVQELVLLIEKTLSWEPESRVTASEAAEEAKELLVAAEAAGAGGR
ncbi:protein kinase domain-containing protein [Endozoicomonas sp.]|uniref:protein kinase domain-containing protein n=1 Tax=Endozoicomonas sp. TaxID=1892382 RepID=UPI002885DCEA|nr:protein kinase [Endozoicomonas sp.]